MESKEEAMISALIAGIILYFASYLILFIVVVVVLLITCANVIKTAQKIECAEQSNLREDSKSGEEDSATQDLNQNLEWVVAMEHLIIAQKKDNATKPTVLGQPDDASDEDGECLSEPAANNDDPSGYDSGIDSRNSTGQKVSLLKEDKESKIPPVNAATQGKEDKKLDDEYMALSVSESSQGVIESSCFVGVGLPKPVALLMVKNETLQMGNGDHSVDIIQPQCAEDVTQPGQCVYVGVALHGSRIIREATIIAIGSTPANDCGNQLEQATVTGLGQDSLQHDGLWGTAPPKWPLSPVPETQLPGYAGADSRSQIVVCSGVRWQHEVFPPADRMANVISPVEATAAIGSAADEFVY